MIENELATQSITNPFLMLESFNMKFDDSSEISSKDSNVQIAVGKITLSSGSQGVFTSVKISTPDDITEVHLRVIGNNIIGTDFELSTDGGGTYPPLNKLTPEAKTILSEPGKDLVLKVTFQSSNTEIDSLCVMRK